MDKFYLSQRPFLEDFLDEVSLFFNVHVYTASEKDYADIKINLYSTHKGLFINYVIPFPPKFDPPPLHLH